MKKHPLTEKIDVRLIGWGLIAIYTLILPDAILIYRKIVSFFGQDTAGRVPLYAAVLLVLAYCLALLLRKRGWKNLLYLIPSGLIAFAIFTSEPNPNKHIHIPEYVLMAWLLYWVLSRDIKGSEIFLLVFLLAALLGVVDELEQGIHPARFYGASDMLVNTASALVGVFTIKGLTNQEKSNWGWIRRLKKMKPLAWLGGVGLALVLFMCINLFRVQVDNEFWGIYPTWLWAGNVMFLALAIVFLIRFHPKHRVEKKDGQACLWIVPMLMILFFMQALVVYVSIMGVEFV